MYACNALHAYTCMVHMVTDCAFIDNLYLHTMTHTCTRTFTQLHALAHSIIFGWHPLHEFMINIWGETVDESFITISVFGPCALCVRTYGQSPRVYAFTQDHACVHLLVFHIVCMIFAWYPVHVFTSQTRCMVLMLIPMHVRVHVHCTVHYKHTHAHTQ
jgi:hypothetical protein